MNFLNKLTLLLSTATNDKSVYMSPRPVIPDLLRKRNTLRLNHAKMQAFWRGTRFVCFSGTGSPF